MSLRASKVDDPQVQRNLNAIYDELNRLRASTANLSGVVESTSTVGGAPTHSNANDPSAGQKLALAGTSGVPGTGNEYVTDDDPRLADKRAPTITGETTDDIMRFNGTNWVRVAKGGNNTVLGVDGGGALGYKADPGGGSGLTHPQVLARGFARC